MTNPQYVVMNGDCLEMLKGLPDNSLDSLVTDPPAGISFMNKAWDDDKGGRDQWIAWLTSIMKEALRVLKPGAHGLVWAIPRTSHWTATALENAGFEVRDVVTHLFGSGFPKSMDISKAIDKAAGAEREIVGSYKATGTARNSKHIGAKTHAAMGDYVADVDRIYQTAPATEDAKRWQGFGTALKPASEHWILIRKPISEKTVAKNVLKWGCGGLNIDASRIETQDNLNGGTYSKNAQPQGASQVPGNGINRDFIQPIGRFPANLVFSCDCRTDEQHDMECAVGMLDKQSGVSKSTMHSRGKGIDGATFKTNNSLISVRGLSDSGGASRFFYCSKASKSDKGPTNNHPTPKSTKLMEYLIQLVTPPGGLVLDCFAGSGSTGVAALRKGFGFIGIEREPEYAAIAEMRLLAAAGGSEAPVDEVEVDEEVESA